MPARRIKTIAATEQGLDIRDGLARRLRTDAGPVQALTEAQLRQLHILLALAIKQV